MNNKKQIIKINKAQAAIIWQVFNSAQHQGLNSMAKLLSQVKGNDKYKEMVSDWLKQSQEEYFLIEELKMQLMEVLGDDL